MTEIGTNNRWLKDCLKWVALLVTPALGVNSAAENVVGMATMRTGFCGGTIGVGMRPSSRPER